MTPTDTARPATAAARSRVLVIDDEPDLRTLYELSLLREGHDVECAAGVDEALAVLRESRFDVVITDMRLPDGTGLDVLRRLQADERAEQVLVITAFGSAENAVEALKAGAFDYLTKPVDLKQFRAAVAQAVATRQASRAAAGASPPLPAARDGGGAGSAAERRTRGALTRLTGRSAAMQQVRSLIARVARGMAPVLVQGESGTGKELVARAIHAESARAAGPFVAVNCGAIPEPMLEAEFFGHRKGSFTGAIEDRPGFFVAAQDGTLFLDEIGELPLAMQSKLLRAIQERAVRAVGATSEVAVNVRLVSATHKDLATEVHEGRFRQDLFYRLNVIPIRVPALRERLDDLPELASALLARIAHEAGVQPPPTLSPSALERLAAQPFPGNVRELENALMRAVTLGHGDVIDADDLALPQRAPSDGAADTGWGGLGGDLTASSEAAEAVPAPSRGAADALPADLAAYLDEVERDVLQRALQRHRFNRTAAGASLGLSLRQMRYRMARLGIQAPDAAGEVAGGGADAPS